MDKYFEFYANGEWKALHVLTWKDAISKSKEYGYKVREITIQIISKSFDPNIGTTVIKEITEKDD